MTEIKENETSQTRRDSLETLTTNREQLEHTINTTFGEINDEKQLDVINEETVEDEEEINTTVDEGANAENEESDNSSSDSDNCGIVGMDAQRLEFVSELPEEQIVRDREENDVTRSGRRRVSIRKRYPGRAETDCMRGRRSTRGRRVNNRRPAHHG